MEPKSGSKLSVSTFIVQFEESEMMFSRDLDLNGVCKEVCVEETFTCITNCDSTDSECISTCLRDELTCGDREY